MRHYLTDHLGSTRAVVDDGGNVLETFDYYPFGLLMPKRNTAGANTIEKFTGKERDTEGNLNLDYFGARFYDPALGKWLGVDPLADRYPSLSPYNYAANNPLFFVDPNGKEIWIHYQDEEGEEQRLRYEVGLEYEGDNEYVSNIVSRFNEIAESKSGSDVLSELIGSENIYTVANKSSEGAGAYSTRTRTFSLPGSLASNSYRNFDIAHELFHGYQHEVGFIKEGDRLINAEVGGYLFGEVVMRELGYAPYIFRPEGSDFSNAMKSLLDTGFSSNQYEAAIYNFKSQSNFNSTGIYNDFKIVNLALLPTPSIKRFLK